MGPVSIGIDVDKMNEVSKVESVHVEGLSGWYVLQLFVCLFLFPVYTIRNTDERKPAVSAGRRFLSHSRLFTSDTVLLISCMHGRASAAILRLWNFMPLKQASS